MFNKNSKNNSKYVSYVVILEKESHYLKCKIDKTASYFKEVSFL